MKTCYYELLQVSQDCTESDLKRSYRKMALKHHPDKNPDNVNEATQKFNEIKSAYEVLSDPHERSWYDSHRTQILSEMDNADVGFPQAAEFEYAGTTSQDIMKYFNPALYSDFSKAYGMINGLYSKLAAEEKLDSAPQFGGSSASYEHVVRLFYQHWANFQTSKSFSWVDEYKYSSTYDRKTRRAIEKENKKYRDQARKEYNESIRNLTRFIKRRDPRVKPGIAKYEAEQKKKRNDTLRKQYVQNRNNENSEYIEQDWEKLNNEELAEIERLLEKIHNDPTEEEDENEFNEFECVICNKIFRTENQFLTHESSKKHKKALKDLKSQMREEGIELGIDEESYVAVELSPEEFVTAEESLDSLSELDFIDDMDDMELEELERKLDEATLKENREKESQENSERQSQEKSQEEKVLSSDSDPQSDYEAPQELKPEQDNQANLHEDVTLLTNDKANPLWAGLDEDDSDLDWSGKSQKKKKNGKKKSTSNTATAATNNTSPPSLDQANPRLPNPSTENCATCSMAFPSRNKLFQHIRDTNHVASPNQAKKKNKSKKKR
ncbi:Co-chaperone [Komagataella phaffii]|nr:GQ67_01633T0 [Komagataella phaffii]AOA66033.1 GQ68_01649T0 [Komagataella phaffii GS115]